jgi:hypothetical protein
MANNTQNHGNMKKERLVLELDIKHIYMDTWQLHQGTRMQNKKNLTFDVHLNSKNYHRCGPNKSYDLFTSFMTYLLIS